MTLTTVVVNPPFCLIGTDKSLEFPEKMLYNVPTAPAEFYDYEGHSYEFAHTDFFSNALLLREPLTDTVGLWRLGIF